MRKRLGILILTLMAFFFCLGMGLSWGQKSSSHAGPPQDGDLGSEIIQSVESGQTVQSSSYNSLYQSSVDNLMNSQKGQATAQILSSSLAIAAETQSRTCDKDSDTGKVDCATAGALLGMATLTQESAESFTEPIMTSWSNVCHFSSIGCADQPPNPFTGGNPENSGFTYGKIDGVTQKLELEGYILNQKNGTITTHDGKTLDPNKPESIRKVLGESLTSQLMKKVKALEAEALRRISGVSLKKYLTSLGLADAVKDFKWGQGESELPAQPSLGSGLEKRKRERAQVERNSPRSTLFKMVEGIPLGVASENIFEMIKRRYQIKEQQGFFYGL